MTQRGGAGDTDGTSEDFGNWRLVYTGAMGAVTERVWAVQVEQAGVMRARLSVSHPGLDENAAAAALREKAHRWIAEYESRPHAGDSDFAPL